MNIHKTSSLSLPDLQEIEGEKLTLDVPEIDDVTNPVLRKAVARVTLAQSRPVGYSKTTHSKSYDRDVTEAGW